MSGSGYTHCACGGCFETVVSDDMDHPDLCDECTEAGCDSGSTECRVDEIDDEITRTRWALIEDGQEYTTIEADSAEEALEIAIDNVDPSCYDSRSKTIWISVEVRCDETDESLSETVALDPDEPDCTERAHDWQSPHEILGGLEENPGVWGHGGGVVIHEVCMHCGCLRITDTWAQNPETGEQGLDSIEYRVGEYADEVAALNEEKEEV